MGSNPGGLAKAHGAPKPFIRRLGRRDSADWGRLRGALWPDCSLRRHRIEIRICWTEPATHAAFGAALPSGRLVGFLEADLREAAEGCDTRPVGYIEGWYVIPGFRRSGTGRRLVLAAEAWARARGCQEMASDCLLDNHVSERAHRSLGYAESGRAIHFRKTL